MIFARVFDLVVAGRRARFRGRRLPCRVGRSGIRRCKREGDGATPAGAYKALRVRYRSDRMRKPATRLEASPIRRRDGWSDDPADSRYNRPVVRPHAFHCEVMWLPRGLYDLVVPLDYNCDPVVAGFGSAIFLHVADRLGRPTAGCVAFGRRDLLWILRWWERRSRVILRVGGAGGVGMRGARNSTD